MITTFAAVIFVMVHCGWRVRLPLVPVTALLTLVLVMEASVVLAAPAWRCTPSGAGNLPVCEKYQR